MFKIGSVAWPVPEQLLKQIQRYVSGETIYIPASEQKKKAWGESSGYRAYLAKRNQAIREYKQIIEKSLKFELFMSLTYNKYVNHIREVKI